MIHTIQIDDKTKVGKNLLGIAKAISEQNKNAVFIDDEADTVPFEFFAKELKASVAKRIAKSK
jgi:hypothetical protein